MTENENHRNTFTAKDIERYHSGKMPAQEMHLLEKASLDDPFLADALDGYRYTQQPVEDMQALKAALEDRLGTKKVVPLAQRNTTRQLLRIAAVFLLLAGAGWLVYQFSLSPAANDIATTTIKPAELSAEAPDTSLNTKTTLGENQAETKDVAVQERTIEKESASAKKKNGEEGRRKKTEAAVAGENADAASVTLSASNRNPAMNRSYRQSDSLMDSSVSSYATKDTVSTDTLVDAAVAAPPQQTITPGRENVIVLQRSKENPMPEVILSKSKPDSASRRPSIVFEEAEPEKGEVYYNDYVAENLQVPDEINFKTTPGEVRLSFDVNDVGAPVNIKVEKSLCRQCDEEAIRLLKEGPKLVKKKKSRKGKVSIRF